MSMNNIMYVNTYCLCEPDENLLYQKSLLGTRNLLNIFHFDKTF